MLGKLIKHDFKALSRILIPTSIAIIGATILATLGIRFTATSYASYEDNFIVGLMKTATVALSAILIIAICAAFFFIAFVVFQRFYKNFMTNEGYLTFTLPVSTSNLLWSKVITAYIWLVISAVVGLLSLFIFLLFGTTTSGFANPEIFRGIGQFFRMLSANYSSGITVLIIEMIFLIIISVGVSVLQIYLALVIGGVVSQKHKLAAGIGFYFVINMVMGVFTSIIQTAFLTGLYTGTNIGSFGLNGSSSVPETINNIVAAIQPYYWSLTGLMIVFAVGFFILTHYLLKNKLNIQ